MKQSTKEDLYSYVAVIFLLMHIIIQLTNMET